MMYLKYLKYVIYHKWYVLVECITEGILWQGVIHDLSKLLPSEFFPYANYFYGDKKESVKENRDETGYYKPYDTGNDAFDYAWLLHQKRNKHHWQWWILPTDEEGIKLFEMPTKYLNEMVCDWKGAGKAQGYKNEDDCKKWYLKNKDKMQLHSKTREKIEIKLGINMKEFE